jgi:peroxiredoxin
MGVPSRRSDGEEVAMADLPAIGSKAPEFDLPLADGGRLTSSELRGSAALLFFFPKASTPG